MRLYSSPFHARWSKAAAVFITLVLAFVNLQEKTIGYWEKPKLAEPPQLLPKATPAPAAKSRRPRERFTPTSQPLG